jgi:hypothetical protein
MSFTQNVNPTLVRQPQNGKVQIANSDGQSQKAVYVAGANGSKIVGLISASTDTAAHDVQLSINVGGTNTAGTVGGGSNYPLGTIAVAAGAGNSSSVGSANLLSPVSLAGVPFDSDGNPYILLQSGDILVASSLVTVTAAKLITVSAIGGDF